MTCPYTQLQIPGVGGLLPGELIVDLFAGGGGASEGIEEACGRPPDIAINHDPAAIAMHAANHPATLHLCESIYDVSPREVTGGQPVGVLWASPSCTHFSRARGGTPVSKQERGLGWMVIRWAALTKPRTIYCENVSEWMTWGPVRKGRPVKSKAGKYWDKFKAHFASLGYSFEVRDLDACDYGTPTARRRMYVIARRDGRHIVWPQPTHMPRQEDPRNQVLPAWRSAAECIDWSDLGTSIFADKAEARAARVKRPLADATLRRIAAGIVRYVLNGRPFLVQMGYGERKGQRPRIMSVDEPLGTVVAGGAKHALCSAFLSKYYGSADGKQHHCKPMTDPLDTITVRDHNALVAAHLVVCNHAGDGFRGQSVRSPMSTIVASRDARGLVAAHLTTIDQQSNAAGFQAADGPLSTITTKQRHALVAAFMTSYYSGGGTASGMDDPVPTIVTRARHGLVTVELCGMTYAIGDICMRMLRPRELATAQGFPSDYILTGTQEEQIGRIGNSVCKQVACAIVRANALPIGLEAVA